MISFPVVKRSFGWIRAKHIKFYFQPLLLGRQTVPEQFENSLRQLGPTHDIRPVTKRLSRHLILR
jgi:hypothetical protein